MQLKKFSQPAQKILIHSQTFARKNHNSLVEPEHLALALINTTEVSQLLKKKSLDHKSLESSLLQLISNLPVSAGSETSFSSRLILALSSAEALSIAKHQETISVNNMLLSLLENKQQYGSLGSVLAKYFLGEEEEPKKASFFDFVEQLNLQIKSRVIDPVFGRLEECDRLVQILSRKTRNNPLLIGEPGVGRTSIVYALVKKIVEQNVPSHLITKEILSLDLSLLIAGTTLRGQFEERFRKILSEIAAQQGRYILLVRDLSMLMGAGGDGASDAANLIKPFLARADIQIIGLVSPDLYKKRIEHDASFARYFQPVWIEQPSPAEAQEILLGLKNSYERFHGVFIDDDAIAAAVDLGAKHLSGRVLPEVALDVLDEACARHRNQLDQKPREKLNPAAQKKYEYERSLIESIRAIKAQISSAELDNDKQALALLGKELNKKHQALNKIKNRLIDPLVKRNDIAKIISQETGIPVQKMLQSEREKLASMEEILGKKVIGQAEAIAAVSSAIRRARVGLKDAKRPIGSFLFLGPTGVGKTELARTLTSFLFDDERAMVRFDMSEFMERHSVARLIGAPPGYQGSEEGGQLTELVRRKPFSVVLFDEIEKAHVDVLNVLLQVLDDGRLTDSKGRLVAFNNTVVIMTSNVGSDILLHDDHESRSKALVRELIMERLLQYLRPELINRIDEIVIFEALDKKGIKNILELMLANLNHKMADEGYDFRVKADLKQRLIEEGYNREFGARPLKRAIQRVLENPLASLLVANAFTKGAFIEACLSSDQQVVIAQVDKHV